MFNSEDVECENVDISRNVIPYKGGWRLPDYTVYLTEKQKIDDLISKGYKIISAKSSFDGDIVVFEHKKLTPTQVTIIITNPDSRKYYTSLYIEHLKKVSNK